MEIEQLRSVFGWCALIHYAVLLLWSGLFLFAHDWMHALHGRWFRIPAEQFDVIHYALLGVFKLGILVFALVPYIALRIVG
jgi:hypothetical protein